MIACRVARVRSCAARTWRNDRPGGGGAGEGFSELGANDRVYQRGPGNSRERLAGNLGHVAVSGSTSTDARIAPSWGHMKGRDKGLFILPPAIVATRRPATVFTGCRRVRRDRTPSP